MERPNRAKTVGFHRVKTGFRTKNSQLGPSEPVKLGGIAPSTRRCDSPPAVPAYETYLL